MKIVLRNREQFDNCRSEIEYLLSQGKQIDLSYELAHKPKTMAQMGFLFAALINECQKFLEEYGFVVDAEDVRYYFYKKVADIVPEIKSDCMLFGANVRIKHLSEYDRATMSKFIDGCFTVIEQDPLFEGIILSPDVYLNFLYHITEDELRIIESQKYPDRDEDYLAFIRTRPCMICGRHHASEAHHIKEMELCGLTQKAPDVYAIPLCHKCHMTIAHGTGFKEKMSWLPYDLKTVCRIMYNRYKNKRF